MSNRKLFVSVIAAAAMAGCSLSSAVSVMPIIYPVEIERGADLSKMLERGDFARGAALAGTIDAKPKATVKEITALARCEIASGRLDSARRHFRRALELHPRTTEYAEIAWALSELEYLANNFAAAEEWARTAEEHGIRVRPWHLKFLASLVNVQVNHVVKPGEDRLPMTFGKPDIPRVPVKLNGVHQDLAVIDSGAVLSIVSESLAARLRVRTLGDFEGQFLGLLGEPIPVRFGLLDSIAMGEIVVENVPVAIMHDENMKFFVLNREPFKMNLLIGSNLLREFRIELNFRRETITFTSLTPELRQPHPEQNLFIADFRPLVHTMVNRKGWYLFVVDTGSEITFLNEESAELTRLRTARRLHGATLQGLGGAQKRGEKIENVEIGVGQWSGTFRDIPLYSSERTEALGIVGQNFMKNFRVVLDFGSMRMELYRDRLLSRP